MYELPASRRIFLLSFGLIISTSSFFLTQDNALCDPVTNIAIDATANRHPISPYIYGVNFGSKADLLALNSPINRQGGNNLTTYNWQNNTYNIDADWYFESLPGFSLNLPTSLVPGERSDSFIGDTKQASSEPMITIPMMGWVAKLTADNQRTCSFSVAKYGPQEKTDQYYPDAGNGKHVDGTLIAGNDPNDAYVPSSPASERDWVRHLIGKWGTASKGGVRFYIMDNEPGLWHTTHRDVYPNGVTSDDYLSKFEAYACMVKQTDPGASIVGPELWGWQDFFMSGADQQYWGSHHYQGHPDKDAHDGLDFAAWLLRQLEDYQKAKGVRLLNVFTAHMYPQGGEDNNDVSQKVQLIRNRSTRSLWDRGYKDESWINNEIMLIPRMKKLVDQNYPGTKIGITEYEWGARDNIGGATAQADILGIFGREDVYLATRWMSPDKSSPVFKSFQMYRNYDGKRDTFGETSVSDEVPNPDDVASFAATRSLDGALTIIVINKGFTDTPVNIAINHFKAGKSAQAWQLTSANKIDQLTPVSTAGGSIDQILPAQSITLYVVPTN
jgi:hypothetical protein